MIRRSADPAGPAPLAGRTVRPPPAELQQGVLNANNGVSALQIVDGGFNDVSTIPDRLRTLATESASSTFPGDRATLNTDFRGC